ncbi:winged helix DNA-binding domain-containing protein [Actinomadura sp. ATCC 31491]|uniref:Winged helix DNA-binding domain-containing protein n=1 Tax=Actinomadura luzonensis TaxID=2805427 RepID=A0ABT0G031_9ACTN|nr:winged helix DNA-binding domain-containing protein [Actinomadura luzonensis]MCK2217758.1 winged helix DNA-binding domain-containing protein [Actinomadura luzonensis]
MTIRVSWGQILAWRLRRQFVSGADGPDAVSVARRLCGVQAQVASSAELAVAVRRARPDRDEITRALWSERTLVKTWLMRGGTLHLVPADELASYCSALATLRFWEKGSWLRYHGVTAGELGEIMEAVPEALKGDPLTREELVEAVVAQTGRSRLREPLTSGWGALLKPLSRLGELCYGPPREGRVTFTTPAGWVPGWPDGLPPQEEAGVRVARAFLGAHGPATPEMFDAWLFGGTARKAVLKGWFRELAPELAEVVTDDGHRLLAPAEHVDDLAGTAPSEAVHLLPGFDQYILGAPRTLAPLIPPGLKAKVSRQAGWISPVVVHEGRVAGVWEHRDGEIVLDLAAPVPAEPLAEAVARLRPLLPE